MLIVGKRHVKNLRRVSRADPAGRARVDRRTPAVQLWLQALHPRKTAGT